MVAVLMSEWPRMRLNVSMSFFAGNTECRLRVWGYN